MPGRVLLTGATGFVGGRLLPALEARGLAVRCLVRRPGSLASRARPDTEVVAGDVRDPEALARALEGVDTAYYLVHAMGAGAGFEAEEREGARCFAAAARAQGVRRIIYLGGLGHDDAPLSAHLRSRQAVGRILRASGVPTLELRASIVIGAGSLSFEMIRALVERLPVMVTPRWVRVAAQPIAIADLIAYLLESLDLPLPAGRVIEIGGASRVSYGELMAEYARQRGLRRTMIPVPFLTPRLSSLWLGLVTPLQARVGRALIDSITHPTEVRDPEALRAFRVRPMGVGEAIARALADEDRAFAAARWFDLASPAGAVAGQPEARFGNRVLDARARDLEAPPARAFAPVERIGGGTGWYSHALLWRVRGWIDRWLGGVGMRRGRPEPLRPGAVIDCWRVEGYEAGRWLRLVAEMKVPGRAWLEFEVVPRGTGATLRQTAAFDPLGLGGLLYWRLLRPVHDRIFAGMLAGIAGAALRAPAAPGRS